MRHVYLIRHALPDFPQGQRMYIGTTDIPLGETGLSQAAAMAAVLPPVTAVFSSPLSRAVQTAQAVCPNVITLTGLRELSLGQWEGLSFQQVERSFPELYHARGIDPTLPIPGQEPKASGLRRFRQALEEAVRLSTGDIAVVAHSGVMAAFLESLGVPWKKPGYTQIIPLTYDGEFHLQEEETCGIC